jgi:hypothetical protein
MFDHSSCSITVEFDLIGSIWLVGLFLFARARRLRQTRSDGDGVPDHDVPGFHRRFLLSLAAQPEQSAPASESGAGL